MVERNQDRRQQERAYLKGALRDVLDDPARRQALKELFKEAHDEWLDRKWAQFGKWTAAGLGALLFSGLMTIYVYSRTKGWL